MTPMDTSMSTPMSTSTLRIDLSAYRHNLQQIQQQIGDNCGIIPVIKSNAYGHGVIPIAHAALQEDVSMLAVGTIAEGLELREHFPKFPILILMQPSDDELPAAVQNNFRLTLSNLHTAEIIGELARKSNRIINVHCEIDTGMGRQGFQLDQNPNAIQDITRISHVDIEGLFTHFPNADSADPAFTLEQIRQFNQRLRALSDIGIPFEITHAANSAALIKYPESHYEAVRPGIITYGIQPNNNVPKDSPFRPIATWSTRIVLIRDLPENTPISYGSTYHTKAPSKIATLPIGYADGYPRALSNNADVLIRGTRCPVRGTVTMNETMVDITDLPHAAPGDPVILIGQDGDQTIHAEELAETCNTIGYEILTGIGPQVVREYHPTTPEIQTP